MILDLLRTEAEGTVRIAALGPLTNLALACQRDPETFARVGGISVMGGALDVPGNTSAVAEFNTFADPWAAKYLFEQAPLLPEIKGNRLPIDLIPLDITTLHTIPYSRLVTAPHGQNIHPQSETNEHVSTTPSILQRFVSTFMTHPRMVTNSFAAPQEFHPDLHDLFQAHDPVAVSHVVLLPVPNGQAATQELSGWKHQLRRFKVECNGDLTRGMCVVDRRGLDKLDGVNKALDGPHANDEKRDKINAQTLDTLNTADVKGTNKQRQGEDQVGLVNVVTGTPGTGCFANMFLHRIDL